MVCSLLAEEQLSKGKINKLPTSSPCARNILSVGYLIYWISCLFLLHLYDSSLLRWLFICLGTSQEITRYNRKLLGFPQLPRSKICWSVGGCTKSAAFLQRPFFLTFAFLVIIVFRCDLFSCIPISLMGALVGLLQEKCICLMQYWKGRKGGVYGHLKSS